MSKTLEFTYKGVDYKLEFTKRTVMEMERRGFVASDVDTKPMTTLPALWAGAFLAHHRWAKDDLIEEIYAHMSDKQLLIGKLAEMYNDPIQSLIEDPENAEGNVNWTASF